MVSLVLFLFFLPGFLSLSLNNISKFARTENSIDLLLFNQHVFDVFEVNFFPNLYKHTFLDCHLQSINFDFGFTCFWFYFFFYFGCEWGNFFFIRIVLFHFSADGNDDDIVVVGGGTAHTSYTRKYTTN